MGSAERLRNTALDGAPQSGWVNVSQVKCGTVTPLICFSSLKVEKLREQKQLQTVLSCSQTEFRLELQQLHPQLLPPNTEQASSSPLCLGGGVWGGADLHLLADPAQRLRDASVNARFVPHRAAHPPAGGSHQFPRSRVLTGQGAAAVALATGPQVSLTTDHRPKATEACRCHSLRCYNYRFSRHNGIAVLVRT